MVPWQHLLTFTLLRRPPQPVWNGATWRVRQAVCQVCLLSWMGTEEAIGRRPRSSLRMAAALEGRE